MRKLILQVQLTLDGFIGRPGGQQDWMTWDWDSELAEYTTGFTSNVDQILLGRKLAREFIPYWETAANKPEAEEYAKRFHLLPKAVFSRTFNENDAEKEKWPHTKILTGELVEELRALKSETGGDMIVYGGAHLIADLIREGLIDDYYFFINPVAISGGLPIFHKLKEDLKLTLVESRGFDCGIVVNYYKNPVIKELGSS